MKPTMTATERFPNDEQVLDMLVSELLFCEPTHNRSVADEYRRKDTADASSINDLRQAEERLRESLRVIMEDIDYCEIDEEQAEDAPTLAVTNEESSLTDSNEETKKSGWSIRRGKVSRLKSSRRQSQESAHQFEEHSYGAPTDCDVCNGLLVGLWSQGLQCRKCGMNIHRGEGVRGHDDCRGEALLTTKCNHLSTEKVFAKEPQVGFAEAVRQICQLAQKSPNFLAQVREQLNRDITTRAADTIVAAGVDGERSKTFLRLKTRLVPLVQFLDSLDSHGELYVFFLLLLLHALLALVITIISITILVVVLWPRHGMLTDTSIRLAVVHDATVKVAIYDFILFLALILRHLSGIFRRKAELINSFLHEKFQIEAEEDFGISVSGAAYRARAWTRRLVVSAVAACVISSLLWIAMQPTSWEASMLPPVSTVVIPTAVLFICASVLAIYSFRSTSQRLVELTDSLHESIRASLEGSTEMEGQQEEEEVEVTSLHFKQD